MIDAILTNTMLPDVSRAFLTRMMEGGSIGGVTVSAGDGKFSYEFA
jgi:type VI secretion system protein VasG